MVSYTQNNKTSLPESRVYPPVPGKHSEIQVFLTIVAGDELEVILRSNKPTEAFLIRGFDADMNTDKVYVTFRVPHPLVAPHCGYLTPSLIKVVDSNFRRVEPLVGYYSHEWATFVFKNEDSYDAEVEICIPIIYSENARGLREYVKKKQVYL